MLLPTHYRDLYRLYQYGIIKPGTQVWACNGQTAMIQPYPGVLCTCRSRCTDITAQTPKPDSFWNVLPIKPDGTYDWYGLKRADTRILTTNKEECDTIFLHGLEQQIPAFVTRLNKMKALRDEYHQSNAFVDTLLCNEMELLTAYEDISKYHPKQKYHTRYEEKRAQLIADYGDSASDWDNFCKDPLRYIDTKL